MKNGEEIVPRTNLALSAQGTRTDKYGTDTSALQAQCSNNHLPVIGLSDCKQVTPTPMRP
jgi:hypothetical protein